MIVKGLLYLFQKEHLGGLSKEVSEQDLICLARSLLRLHFCDPEETGLMALIVDYHAPKREKTKRIFFVPKGQIRDFTQEEFMESMDSLDIDGLEYMKGVLLATKFYPEVYRFEQLRWPAILGAEYVGSSQEFPEVFLREHCNKIRTLRLQYGEKPVPCSDGKPKKLTEEEQIAFIRAFLHNKLELYRAMRAAAQTVKDSAH